LIVSESYLNVLRVAVLVSGNGTNLQAIIDQIHSGFLADVEIIKVISTREQAFALKRAEKNLIPFAVVSRSLFPTQAEYDRALMDELSKDEVDLIVLAGFLSKLGPDFFKAFPDVINVHPSLIPSFCGQGMYGLKVHEAVLTAGVKVTGATVHQVDEEYDSGPILMQTSVPVRENDTPKSLQKRVMEEGEHVILPQAIRIYADKKKKDWKG
jgi:phosphoribosylglycinamide formyltransferase 1